MILVSAALFAWQHFGMNRNIRIDGASSYKMQTSDDRTNGGASVAKLSRNGKQLLLDCSLSDQNQWPFCELGVYLTPTSKGIDLTGFDRVNMKVDYRGPGNRQIRFFVRNYDPAYAKEKDESSWKINEVAFTPKPGGETVSIPLTSFSVTSWWIANNHIPLDHIAPDMRHVPLVQVSTSGFKEPGQHELVIDYIEFHGKWLSREQLALLLVGLWVGYALLTLALDLRHLRKRLQRSRRREHELRGLTKALQLENRLVGDMARRDPLTGVRNRAGIRDELFREVEFAQESGQPLAAVFADIDHFKRVNDTLGHDVGDKVLQQFAKELGGQIRSDDYVVRWGGEEFVLIFPATPLHIAAQLAEKIRKQVESKIWPDGLRITSSFGVTVLGDESIADFVKRADEALYDAKSQGRNCVVTREPITRMRPPEPE